MNNEMNTEMTRESEDKKYSPKKKKSGFVKILLTIAAIQVIIGIAVGTFYVNNKYETDETKAQIVESQEETLETETEEVEDPLLQKAKEKHKENSDLVGWMKIEGTVVDYPIMYTPDDPEKYLRLNFDENYSVAGLPFMDSDCSMNPESDNLIIYGHNMLDGSMFKTIMDYANEEHWKEHPVIRFATLEEEREYEVLSAFYDRVYYKYEDCFKFYQFIDAEDEEAYDEAIAYYKENAVYETGVTAEYGDRLITLVTCSEHHQYGRFVVVAREARK